MISKRTLIVGVAVAVVVIVAIVLIVMFGFKNSEPDVEVQKASELHTTATVACVKAGNCLDKIIKTDAPAEDKTILGAIKDASNAALDIASNALAVATDAAAINSDPASTQSDKDAALEVAKATTAEAEVIVNTVAADVNTASDTLDDAIDTTNAVSTGESYWVAPDKKEKARVMKPVYATGDEEAYDHLENMKGMSISQDVTSAHRTFVGDMAGMYNTVAHAVDQDIETNYVPYQGLSRPQSTKNRVDDCARSVPGVSSKQYYRGGVKYG
jgi:hypothetical protein